MNRTCVYFSMKTMSKELIPNSSSFGRCCLCHVLKTSKRMIKKRKKKMKQKMKTKYLKDYRKIKKKENKKKNQITTYKKA